MAKDKAKPETVDSICSGIKSLKIQGARNVAIAAVRALAITAGESKARAPSRFYGELLEAAELLASTRPTEPMLRNSIRLVLANIEKRIEKGQGVAQLKAAVKKEYSQYLSNVQMGIDAIAGYGAALVPKGGRVLVHCHSSSVVAILKKAYDTGRLDSVTCTETRPRYQGRITARELSEHGIDTTIVVDSAAAVFIPQVDMVLVGADAVSATGDLVNKIGTRGIAQIAFDCGVPFYSAAEIYKFEPVTVWGRQIEIEERDTEEVVARLELPKAKVRNLAFDLTPAKYVKAFVTERGVVPPYSMLSIAGQEFKIKNPIDR
ncbi:MAG: S-methyl-5-thioribose-1-phosphate isomerase [Candidatus Micrarchaeia archaeon]